MAAPTPDPIAEEEGRLRRLRHLVDCTRSLLYQQPSLSLEEAVELIDCTRRAALALFPGQEGKWDLIYRPRFRRILLERYGPRAVEGQATGGCYTGRPVS